jgi:hypothetical protein
VANRRSATVRQDGAPAPPIVFESHIVPAPKSRPGGPNDGTGPRCFYVGTLKGVGRIYQQTIIDTYSKAALAKLYAARRRSLPPRSSTTGCRSMTGTASGCRGC